MGQEDKALVFFWFGKEFRCGFLNDDLAVLVGLTSVDLSISIINSLTSLALCQIAL